jgi:hypothetical protein
MTDRSEKLEHLFVARGTSERPFTTPGTPRDPNRAPSYPQRTDPVAHARSLLGDLSTAARDADALEVERQNAGLNDCAGAFIDVKFVPNEDFPLKSLTDASAQIELVTVTELAPNLAQATLFVPDGKLKVLERKIEAFAPNDPTKARRNLPLVSSLESIRRSVARSFWTEPTEPFPSEPGELWWEVWLRGMNPERFRTHAKFLMMRVSDRTLRFPDRTVVLVRASVQQMTRSAELLDSIAELRRAPPLDLELLELDASTERELALDLQKRAEPAPVDAPAVCLLDTGVDFDHPLLRAALPRDKVHTCFGEDVRDSFGTGDWHGTGSAGLALYGLTLDSALLGSETWQHTHHLESVKYIPSRGENEPDLYGEITKEAIAHAEIRNPHRKRVFVNTVTAERIAAGEPSSWSAAVDQLCAGVDAEDEVRRLIVLAAGNVHPSSGYAHPDTNHLEVVQDPGQAWNALSIGTYTERITVKDRAYVGWMPIAAAGGLSPTARTTLAWIDTSRMAPPVFKPDFVCEGGNWAVERPGTMPAPIDSLTPISTRRRDGLQSRLLARFGASSGAAALAGNLAVQLQAKYPQMWPETVRALLVHSCRYTAAMEATFREFSKRKQVERRLRCFGYGVPDVERAKYSARNELTLVLERQIQPFCIDPIDKKGKTNEMHLHRLPWPEGLLETLGALQVRLRVTLSYFIEPNPGKRGVSGDARTQIVDPARYPSFGLRFEVTKAGETPEVLLARVNAADRSGDESTKGDLAEWDLGNLRKRGSIHSDVWRGTAAALADKHSVAVFPTSGWWRFRNKNPEICERKARYALVVSIETDDESVDVYTPVMNAIAVTR